jgi:ferric-dicitrate binding protein FerR (iron transport regulator)
MISRILLALAALAGAAFPAAAQTKIGQATAITVEVTGDVGGTSRVLNTGDSVFANEVIETDSNGIGQFEFLDQTRLAVGSDASVKLDRFVYDANRKATEVVIQLGRGAFRFMSGGSPSEAYKISTSTATLGVRGTAFDLYVAPDGEIAVAMIDGQIDVCPRGGACRPHNVVGKFLRLTREGRFSLHDRWDGSFLRGVSIHAALPFLARQELLHPRFHAKQTAAARYARHMPRVIERTTKGLPKAIVPPAKRIHPPR